MAKFVNKSIKCNRFRWRPVYSRNGTYSRDDCTREVNACKECGVNFINYCGWKGHLDCSERALRRVALAPDCSLHLAHAGAFQQWKGWLASFHRLNRSALIPTLGRELSLSLLSTVRNKRIMNNFSALAPSAARRKFIFVTPRTLFSIKSFNNEQQDRKFLTARKKKLIKKKVLPTH